MGDDLGGALTGLSMMDEFQFRNWLKDNAVPFDPEAKSPDYDMRGYWQGLRQGSPHVRAPEVNPNDMRPHFTDYYKTPSHETYSAESRGAGPSAPRWNRQDQLVAPDGTVLYDEKFNALLRRR